MRNYRIREVNLKPGVTWFFPQEEEITYKQKGMWWWKTYETISTWRYIQNFDVKKSFLIDDVDISWSSAANTVSFKTLDEAKEWLNEYKEHVAKRVQEVTEKIYKTAAIDKKNSETIHPS